MDPDSKRLYVSVTDGRGRPVRDGGLARWLQSVAPRRARGSLAVALASDARVRALNRRYRRVDHSTDVLSFAPDDPPSTRRPRSARPAATAGSRDAVLGDIVIARGVARRQARAAGHSWQAELRVLALHGLLHLLGYDHDSATDRARMARVESQLRRKGALGAGLIERTARRRGTREGRR